MSERLGFHVDVEGVDDAIRSMNTMLADVSRVTSLIGTADYAFSSWQRAVKEFDVLSFTRSLIATITLMQSLLAVTKMATASQQAFTMAQAAGQQMQLTGWMGGPATTVAAAGGTGLTSLLGPIGAILAVSLTMLSVVNQMNKNYAALTEQLRKDAEQRQFNRALYEDALQAVEERRRENYRSVVP